MQACFYVMLWDPTHGDNTLLNEWKQVLSSVLFISVWFACINLDDIYPTGKEGEGEVW